MNDSSASLLKAYIYEDRVNFGDRLNFHVLSLFGRQAVSASVFECDMVCIGSVLNTFVKHPLVKLKKRVIDNKMRRTQPIHVWGAGFIKEPKGMRRFIRRPIIHALRGELTLRRCRSIPGCDVRNVVLGDPGLLVDRLIDVAAVEKRFDVGIIPHMFDRDSELLNRIKLDDQSMVVIDVTDDPLLVLRRIASCRIILSSAMHGLIAADAFNIPNKRILLDTHRKSYSFYKFQDYYSIYGMMEPRPWALDERDFTDQDVDRIAGDYVVPRNKVVAIQNALTAAFPGL